MAENSEKPRIAFAPGSARLELAATNFGGRRHVKPKARTIVGDLADWDLPSLDRGMEELIEFVQQKKLTLTIDEDSLGEQLYAQLFDRIRALGATAANEAIMGWLQGLADGAPELAIEFPYVRGDRKAAPLTVTYSVAAKDGMRTEVRRVDFESAITEALAAEDLKGKRKAITTTIVAHLRDLANQLERLEAP